MRKYAVAVALATTRSLAAPALAMELVHRVEAGALISEATNFDIRNAAGTQLPERSHAPVIPPATTSGGTLGYDFGVFRAEFEVAHKDANLDSFNVNAAPAIAGRNGVIAVQRAAPTSRLTVTPARSRSC
jgi:hypothetical protein